MKQREIIDWLMENPACWPRLRILLMTNEEVVRRAAVCLSEDCNVIEHLVKGLPARQILMLKHRLELMIFDRQGRDKYRE